jgi:UDP-N-acetyl-D-mannosaminuronic acid transferase (WecB/TagA/CpsF family)
MKAIERHHPRQILGLRFFTGTADDAVDAATAGSLVVAPSAPVLVELQEDFATREALVHADLVIADSGLMVLLWRLMQGESVRRVSGLKYLQSLLGRVAGEAGLLWVVPSEASRGRIVAWLRSIDRPCRDDDFYIAPRYSAGRLEDVDLLRIARERRPRHIIIALGGGTQERLGFFLKSHLDEVPGIHCIGAAIAFLTGEQVRIPMWADALFLGWLFRCISEPKRFVPRYWRAISLISLMWRYGDRLPEFTQLTSEGA